MAQLNEDEIEKRFGFHKATIENGRDLPAQHGELRMIFKEIAKELDDRIPDGRNKSLALTALEESSMWCHKGLAND